MSWGIEKTVIWVQKGTFQNILNRTEKRNSFCSISMWKGAIFYGIFPVQNNFRRALNFSGAVNTIRKKIVQALEVIHCFIATALFRMVRSWPHSSGNFNKSVEVAESIEFCQLLTIRNRAVAIKRWITSKAWTIFFLIVSSMVGIWYERVTFSTFLHASGSH